MKIEQGISCNSCVGACCRKGMLIELSQAEEIFLRQGGTRLAGLYKAGERADWAAKNAGETSPNIRTQSLINNLSHLAPGNGLYLLLTDCGYLDKNTAKCTEYRNRTAPCRAFQSGSAECIKTRSYRSVTS
ncbi:MAG: YkgJ family cysteine cluster protein [Candidatus Levyibacteriota bacterium]